MEIGVIDFTDAMKKLYDSFGRNYTSGIAETQIISWYDQWRINFPTKTMKHLRAAINFAVDNCETFPNWASFRKIVGDLKVPELIRQTEECSRCFSSGAVSATFEGNSYCFRCPSCRGANLSESIPVWHDSKTLQGYSLLPMFGG